MNDLGATIGDTEFATLRTLIRRESGISLSESKRQLVCSRLSKRLRHLGLGSYSDYNEYLRGTAGSRTELQAMINCITTNKTDFYREPHHFEFLRTEIFARSRSRPIRIWSAGCSSGEEPYTLAMAAIEYFGADAAARVSILASDIDTDVLAMGRAGTYPEERLAGLEAGLMRKHFLRGTGSFAGTCHVRPALQGLVDFEQINFIDRSWPVRSGLDAIFCRNVIIYFDRETQARLMQRFAALLNPGGYLVLGHSENLHWLSDTFEAVGKTVYRIRPGREGPLTLPSPAGSAAQAAPTMVRIEAGGVFAGKGNVIVRTLLGSCVSACLFDPDTGIGGMNHFMLPERSGVGIASARYGVHAMEILINDLMKLGADRRRLRAKVFGGAAVLNLSMAAGDVAGRNIEFVRRFLATEGIPVDAERMGGTQALEVRFEIGSWRVQVRAIGGERALDAEREEQRYRRSVALQTNAPAPDAAILF